MNLPITNFDKWKVCSDNKNYPVLEIGTNTKIELFNNYIHGCYFIDNGIQREGITIKRKWITIN